MSIALSSYSCAVYKHVYTHGFVRGQQAPSTVHAVGTRAPDGSVYVVLSVSLSKLHGKVLVIIPVPLHTSASDLLLHVLVY